MDPVESILIVGGGAAGWLTAGLLAAKLGKRGVRVMLVESSDIPIVGVGEGTWPTMRNTLKAIGVSETEFLRECNATFKQGSQFINWIDGCEGDSYYHPFSLPAGFPAVDPVAPWVEQKVQSFAHFTGFQAALCDRSLAPKSIVTPEYQGIANYGYHLDAGRFAGLLKSHCTNKLSVRHVVDTVAAVPLSEDGSIEAVGTENNGQLKADLYVDCTGFASLLLGQALSVPFCDKSDVLFSDSALAVQVPYEDPNCTVASQTNSTAQEAGWIWDIGLTNRRGVGYVFSSKHTNEDRACEVLGTYIGSDIEEFSPRLLKFQVGHREKFWKKNCVAVGMSAGFLEPLEASALMLIESAATAIADGLPPDRRAMAYCAGRFNKAFGYRWQRIIEFLKLHYVLSKRDEPFWQDHRRLETIPGELAERLEFWRQAVPSELDFESANEIFPPASYLYVLNGMGAEPDLPASDTSSYAPVLQNSARASQRALDELPDHRALLTKVRDYGMQAI